jgi:hypothetical protein
VGNPVVTIASRGSRFEKCDVKRSMDGVLSRTLTY